MPHTGMIRQRESRNKRSSWGHHCTPVTEAWSPGMHFHAAPPMQDHRPAGAPLATPSSCTQPLGPYKKIQGVRGHLVALRGGRGAVEALVLEAAQAHVVADDVQHAHHLAEDQHAAPPHAQWTQPTASFSRP